MYSQPWFRRHDDWWYCYVQEGGKRRQVKLAKGKQSRQQAWEFWHELCLKKKASTVASRGAVAPLLDEYLDWCLKNRARATFEIYRHYLQSFCSRVGELKFEELRPKHVTGWLGSTTWSDTTRAGAAQTVRTAFRRLLREGHIDSNPVAEARGPSRRRREKIMTPEQYQLILDNSRSDFRQLLEFIRHTGCRPHEATAVEARHVDLANHRIVFPAAESKGKRHPRVIYLDSRATEIVKERLAKNPTGPLFRNSRGRKWDRNMVRCRFRRLRPVVGEQFCAYHVRHTFATWALQKLDPIVVATLMGHSDASTLARNYQHLAKLPEYMIAAAIKATS